MSVKGHTERTRRWVIKIGSALLTRKGVGLDSQAIDAWIRQIANIRLQGIDVVLISSGAVACGMQVLKWDKRPSQLTDLQAAAAIGQSDLVQTYEQSLQQHDLTAAQILLTHQDMSDRLRYLNARQTIRRLLSLNVVPIVNENDTVATDEIRFGDNDTLAALVANLIEAELLVILTDQDGVFSADPRVDSQATLIKHAGVDDSMLDAICGPGLTDVGRGGMVTKLKAARTAARSGADTFIVNGRYEDVLLKLARDESMDVGTLLKASSGLFDARQQWMLGLSVKGALVLDDGACDALLHKGSSLLSVGVVDVQGDFGRGELVVCRNQDGREIGRGLVNYSAEDGRKIQGVVSEKISSVLGYCHALELIHRDNLVLTGSMS